MLANYNNSSYLSNSQKLEKLKFTLNLINSLLYNFENNLENEQNRIYNWYNSKGVIVVENCFDGSKNIVQINISNNTTKDKYCNMDNINNQEQKSSLVESNELIMIKTKLGISKIRGNNIFSVENRNNIYMLFWHTFLNFFLVSVIQPTNAAYIKSIHNDSIYTSIVMAVNPIGSIFGIIIFNFITKRSLKLALYISIFLYMLGSFLYVIATNFNSLYLIILGRFIIGIGAARVMIRKYIIVKVPKLLALKYSSFYVKFVVLGQAIGPLINLLFYYCSDFSLFNFLYVNEFTLPGYVGFIASLIYLIFIVFYFTNPVNNKDFKILNSDYENITKNVKYNKDAKNKGKIVISTNNFNKQTFNINNTAKTNNNIMNIISNSNFELKMNNVDNKKSNNTHDINVSNTDNFNMNSKISNKSSIDNIDSNKVINNNSGNNEDYSDSLCNKISDVDNKKNFVNYKNKNINIKYSSNEQKKSKSMKNSSLSGSNTDNNSSSFSVYNKNNLFNEDYKKSLIQNKPKDIINNKEIFQSKSFLDTNNNISKTETINKNDINRNIFNNCFLEDLENYSFKDIKICLYIMIYTYLISTVSY